MSKAVLISIKPQWAKKIFEGKKTIEIRRTHPSIDMPFKVYVYQTKHKGGKAIVSEALNSVYGGGKVIGSFVCDRIREIIPLGLRGFKLGAEWLKEMCLSKEQLDEYGGLKTLYSWHITEPKLFDKPRELCEFYAPCRKGKETADESCKGCSYAFKGVSTGEIICDNAITRPPQSFCYIEVDE